MEKIKNGDIVGRKSYNKDIIFIVVDSANKQNVILKGIFERIIADSNISDLELISKQTLENNRALREKKIESIENRLEKDNISGKILHLDAVCFIIYMIRFMWFIKNKI